MEVSVTNAASDVTRVSSDLLCGYCRAFCGPTGVFLYVTNGIGARGVLGGIRSTVGAERPIVVRHVVPGRPSGILGPFISRTLRITRPVFYFNCGRGTGATLAVGSGVYATILLRVVTNSSSPLCGRLAGSKLVGSRFSFRCFGNANCSTIVFRNRSVGPGDITRGVGTRVSHLGRSNLGGGLFGTVEDKLCNDTVHDFGDIRDVAVKLIRYTVGNATLFSSVGCLGTVAISSICGHLSLLSGSGAILSIVIPGRGWGVDCSIAVFNVSVALGPITFAVPVNGK